MEKKEGQEPNRLIDEKSPYLLQHAHNPMDWFPGVRRPLPRRSQRTSRSSYPSAIQLAIDGMFA
jgi:hypothetical protein